MNNENTFLPSLIIFISILVLILFNYSIFYIPSFIWIMPWLSTIGVFSWTIFSKKEFTIGHVFILGIIEDIIVGSSLGFHALALILIYRLSLQQRKYLAGKPFSVIWFAFSLSLILVYVIAFILNNILGNSTSSIGYINWLTTVLIFPVIHLLLLCIKNKWIKK